MLVLGIETSCDETSAALVEDAYTVRSNTVRSQMEHAQFGGVVPELASRAHMRAIVPVVEESLARAHSDWQSLDGVAATNGPGLAGSLIVGLTVAKALALAIDVPLVGVHHLEGHIFSLLIENSIEMPMLVLLVSGGHTELVEVRQLGDYSILGRTRDDAAGEAFDKVAKILGILPSHGPILGGKVVAELAERGDPETILFPRALEKESSLDLSFSGLKTAVVNYVRKLGENELARRLPDIAAGFQAAVVDALVGKTMQAMRQTGIRQIAIAGGVAANESLRRNLSDTVVAAGGTFYSPSPALCTDNAAMIAAAGHYHLSQGRRAELDIDISPRLSL